MGRWVRCFRTGRYAALVLLLDEMASFPLLRGKGLIIPFADGCAGSSEAARAYCRAAGGGSVTKPIRSRPACCAAPITCAITS